MDKTLFEKYINEMRAMKASAIPEPKRPAAVVYRGNDKDMTGSGTLKIRVTSVRGLYPVANAKVTVFTGNADGMMVIAEGNTDISGASPDFTLPAPAAELYASEYQWVNFAELSESDIVSLPVTKDYDDEAEEAAEEAKMLQLRIEEPWQLENVLDCQMSVRVPLWVKISDHQLREEFCRLYNGKAKVEE